jgi:hypothetical protein
MRRFIFLVPAAAFALVSACSESVTTPSDPGPALAKGNPGTGASNWLFATGSVNADGQLVVSFAQSGVGNNDVDYVLTADLLANWACVNGGSNRPRAANKRAESDEVSAGGSFESQNGQISGTLVAPEGELEQPGDWSCPSGQTETLISVRYTNIVLTNSEDGSIGVQSVQRSFFP